ncbi:hypothetical protein GF324_08570 [bacterium]|nr:hypothetical protein [bacterium]
MVKQFADIFTLAATYHCPKRSAGTTLQAGGSIVLKGRVLITRARDRAHTLIERLHTAGVDAFAVPVTETRFLHQQTTPEDLDRFNWAAFTSVNAVIAFQKFLRYHKDRLPKSLHLAAIGRRTAEEVEKAFGRVDFVSPEGHGGPFARHLLQAAEPAPEAVLWPCAEATTGTFSRPLKEAGVEVAALLLYRTLARKPNALRKELQPTRPWDAIVFAAPSAVRAFVDTDEPPWDATTVAIGDTTGRALRRYGISDPVIAAEPSEDGLFHAIEQVLQARTPETKE